jgi:hypothetical protein
MKYIKRYNESNSEVLDEQEIKDFCEMNLAYLMDEGLKVIVDDFGYGVILSLKDVDEKNRKWIDIKDQIIPFLIRLKDQYELKTFSWVTDLPTADIVFVTSMKYGTEDEGYSDYFTTDGVINDRITRDWAKFTSIYKVNEISFYIKNKKLT